MIRVKLGGQADHPHAPLLVTDTGMPLVEQSAYIEGIFGGLLAHPELFPTAHNYEEIRYSLSGADGADLLTEDTPVATSITEEELAQLQRGLEALKARQRGALKTQSSAISTFRLPSYRRHPSLYRRCVDPATGERRLAILWGVGVRDETGRVVDDGPVLAAGPGALIVLLPPIAAGDATPAFDSDPADGDLALAHAATDTMPAARGAASTCKCWTVATVFLLVVAVLAGLFYWWANRQYRLLASGQKAVADSLVSLGDRVDVLGKRLDENTKMLAAKIDAADKRLGEANRALVTRLDATDARLDETVAAVNAIGERLAANEKRTEDLAVIASKTAEAIEALQGQVKELDGQVKRLDGDIGRVENAARVQRDNVEHGDDGLAELRAHLDKQDKLVEALIQDTKEILRESGKASETSKAEKEVEGMPRARPPGSLGQKSPPGTTPGTGVKPPKHPIRRVDFPAGALPRGVVAPLWENELHDLSKWTLPPGQEPFQAKGFLVDNDENKESFEFKVTPPQLNPSAPQVSPREGQPVNPAGADKRDVHPEGTPQVFRRDYQPVNPADAGKLDMHPDRPPTVKKGVDVGDGIDVQVREYDKGNNLIGDKKKLRITPSNTFAFPLQMRWRRIRGDVRVADVHIGDKPPSPLSPVEKEGSNVYTVEIVDANGKVMSTTAAKPVIYKPGSAPKKE